MVPISYYNYGHNRTSPGDVLLMVVAVIAVVVGAGALIREGVKAEARENALEAEWDAGNGRPNAIELVRNPASDVAVELPHTIGEPIEWWDDCGTKSCKNRDIRRYPVVYKIGTLRQTEPNCFVGKPDNPVDSLMIASTRGGAYKFTYAGDGKRFTVCAVGPRQDNDKIVVWSDKPGTRL